MYSILLEGEMFFDPRIDGYPLGSPKLVREANKIGTLSFTIYPPHPAYGGITMLKSVFSVLRDGVLIYQGRPAYSNRLFKGGIEYKCEEVTAIMNDYMMRPSAISGGIEDVYEAVISSFNDRSQTLGIRYGKISMPAASVDLTSDYIGHWDALQKYLVGQYGGYIVPRYENGGLYLDYLPEEVLPSASQVVRFGQNMKDMFLETDTDETYSGIIPIGGVPDGGTEKITIASVNDGQDVLYNPDAVELYGVREFKREWPDVTDPAQLMELGNAWLRENAVKFRQAVQISAVDLHNADFCIQAFEYMHRVKAESSRHNLSAWYLLAREEIPLDRPTGTVITMGQTRRTLTESMTA